MSTPVANFHSRDNVYAVLTQEKKASRVIADNINSFSVRKALNCSYSKIGYRIFFFQLYEKKYVEYFFQDIASRIKQFKSKNEITLSRDCNFWSGFSTFLTTQGTQMRNCFVNCQIVEILLSWGNSSRLLRKNLKK